MRRTAQRAAGSRVPVPSSARDSVASSAICGPPAGRRRLGADGCSLAIRRRGRRLSANGGARGWRGGRPAAGPRERGLFRFPPLHVVVVAFLLSVPPSQARPQQGPVPRRILLRQGARNVRPPCSPGPLSAHADERGRCDEADGAPAHPPSPPAAPSPRAPFLRRTRPWSGRGRSARGPGAPAASPAGPTVRLVSVRTRALQSIGLDLRAGARSRRCTRRSTSRSRSPGGRSS